MLDINGRIRKLKQTSLGTLNPSGPRKLQTRIQNPLYGHGLALRTLGFRGFAGEGEAQNAFRLF